MPLIVIKPASCREGIVIMSRDSRVCFNLAGAPYGNSKDIIAARGRIVVGNNNASTYSLEPG